MLYIVFHRIDFDGLASLAVVADFFQVPGMKPLGYNYGDPIPEELSRVTGKDSVVILDVCLPVAVMKTLSASCSVVWIDHHRTAIQESVKEDFDAIPGLRQEGIAACRLAWRYFFGNIKEPESLRLLGLYDVWDHSTGEWEERILPFQYGCRSRFNLDVDRFLEADILSDDLTDELLREGQGLIGYIRSTGAGQVAATGFPVTVDGVPATAVLGRLDSLVMADAMTDDRPVVLSVTRRDDLYVVSARTRQGDQYPDLGGYLKKAYGGGGHQAAAGCSLTREQFFQFLVEGSL